MDEDISNIIFSYILLVILNEINMPSHFYLVAILAVSYCLIILGLVRLKVKGYLA